MKINQRIAAFLSVISVLAALSLPLRPVYAWTAADAPVAKSYIGGAMLYGFQNNSEIEIAFDNAGNLYVTRDNQPFVRKYNSSMQFVMQWGSPGTGDGQFNSPYGVATDSSNNVYVIDKGNSRIQKFDSSGNFITKWGSAGSGNGQFNWPDGIGVDASDNVFVVDANNNRVQKFTSSGTYVTQVGGPGSGNGQFNGPHDVDFDSSGNVWVVEFSRVQKFDSNLGYLAQFGTLGTGNGQIQGGRSIAIDSNDRILVLDGGESSAGDNVQVFNLAGVYQSQFGSQGSGDGQFQYGGGMAVDASDNIYVADIQGGLVGGRIMKFNSSGVYQSKMQALQSDNGEVNYPYQMVADSSGNVYVADSVNNRVQKFNSAGAYVSQWNVTSTSGIAIDGSGNILSTAAGGGPTPPPHKIVQYSPAGSFISEFGSTGSGNNQFSYPFSLAVDSSGNIYVADSGNLRVQKFDSSFNYLSTITGNGGDFGTVEAIAIDGNDNLYVLDSDNGWVQKFNSAGVFQAQIEGHVTPWNYPEGMTVDTQGNLYVSDSGNNVIQIFDNTGTFAQEITGSQTYFQDFSYLQGLALNSSGTMFISDQNRIQTVTFDRVPAVVSVTPLSGDQTQDTTPAFTGTATDALTALTDIEYSIDNGGYTNCTADDSSINELSEAFTCSVGSPISVGAHNVKVRTTDSKTNTNTGGNIASYDFTVLAASAPTVTTGAVSAITGTTATVAGNVTSDGGASVTERGIVYSSSQAVPTTSDSKQTTTGTTGSMSVGLSGLSNTTHYYARAYATNSVNTSYGSVVEFDTDVAGTSPTVTTGAASSIGETTATVAGNVTSDGGVTVTERGIVYSSSATTPTTANSKQTTTGTTGVMSVNLSGLSRATTYYARAYAINSQGTSYGSVVSFKTLEPAVLRNVYFTFAKLKYNQTYANTVLKTGDTAYIKNYNTSQLKLLQVFLYDYAKHGNQGFTKSKVTSNSMYLNTTTLLAKGKRYAYVMKFQDKATGLIATKYFVLYTKN